MSSRVLLLGGHGKVSLLMTPLLLSRSWQVTSIVRNPDHTQEIQAKAKGLPGRLDVLVRSLDNVETDQQAQAIINESRPDYVIFSAGAGGKGGPDRTYAVDREAARSFIIASIRTPSVKKFLMVSYIGSRRNRAPWWTDEDWESCQKVNKEILPHYAIAKRDADECLSALARQRTEDGFQGICLRPGTLSDDPATGKVALGHTSSRGAVTRADVADVAVRLLERDETRGYYDLLNGNEDIVAAIERVVKDKVDCIEGEDLDAITKMYKL